MGGSALFGREHLCPPPPPNVPQHVCLSSVAPAHQRPFPHFRHSATQSDKFHFFVISQSAFFFFCPSPKRQMADCGSGVYPPLSQMGRGVTGRENICSAPRGGHRQEKPVAGGRRNPGAGDKGILGRDNDTGMDYSIVPAAEPAQCPPFVPSIST